VLISIALASQAANDCYAANPCVTTPQAQCEDTDMLMANSPVTCHCPSGYTGDGKVNGTGCSLPVTTLIVTTLIVAAWHALVGGTSCANMFLSYL
jgi:hypothetical protein